MNVSARPRRTVRRETALDPVRIERLVQGGMGLARVSERGTIFVEGVVPGDLVEVAPRPHDTGARPAYRVVRVLEAGPHRVEPVCAWRDRCGGCDWMHVAPSAQLELHAGTLAEVLERALGLEVAPPVVAHPADSPLHYRRRARLGFRLTSGRLDVGYRASSSRDLVAVDECVVLEPGLLETAREVLRAAQSNAQRGELRGELSVSFGRDRKVVLELALESDAPPQLWSALDRAVKDAAIAGARVHAAGASVPAVFGDPSVVVRGADGEPLVAPAGGFTQASEVGSALLARRVRALGEPDGASVLELFAGAGTLSVELARGARRFAGVELDAAAVACARENLAVRSLEGRFRCADAEQLEVATGFDLVVLDPPRAGAPKASSRIAKARPRRVVYVSCNPATLGRDLRVLVDAGYGLDAVETFELFPQTSHVETVVRLTPRRRTTSG